MNDIRVEQDRLIVEPKGLDKVWSFTRQLTVPMTHVRGATYDPGANREPKGVRAPGLGLPGKTAGTFHRDGQKSFWNVSRPDDTIVIELKDESYHRLILTVDEPREVVREINNAVSAMGASMPRSS